MSQAARRFLPRTLLGFIFYTSDELGLILQIVQKKPRSFVVQYMGSKYEVSVHNSWQWLQWLQ
jgi:hypothetical protein